jgi:murein DD-endopeptidase MepM/ murein hydrolase activator NlpD
VARLLKLLVLTALLACGATRAAAALNDYPFHVEARPYDDFEQVYARNDGPAPITLSVTLKSENLSTTADWPLTAVVPAHAEVPLAYMAPSDPDRRYRYLFNYTYYVGRVDAHPDAKTLYRLPFPDGQAYAITQAYGAVLTSHNNEQNRYAIDFDMPVGTPVVAARDGVVVDVVVNYKVGGDDPALLDRANMVTIVHDDGTIAEYAHLSPGAAVVKRGERVTAGTLLGYSGNTGYSTGPHLHFVVSRPAVENGKVVRLSLPVRFYADDRHMPLTVHTGEVATADYRDATAMYAARAPRSQVAAQHEGDPPFGPPSATTARGSTKP